jgi:phosphate transport system substrate-binding protein
MKCRTTDIKFDRKPHTFTTMTHLQNSLESIFIICLVLLFIVTGCGSSAKPTSTPVPTVTLTISGSGSTTSILEAIAPTFESAVADRRLEILPGTGSGGGVQGVIDGTLDVAGMARPPKDDELESAPSLKYVPLGQGAVAFYTHPSVDISEITTEQAIAIFSGEVTNWSDVGGSDQPIILYVRDEGDSSTQTLRAGVFGEIPFAEAAQILTSQGDMQTAVEGTPDSIGFGTWPAALAAKTNVHALSLDGIAPGDAAYPMVIPIGIAYLDERQTDVQPLIDWLLSESGQQTLQTYDVIPIQ